ncbi:hypothetical protein K435DRAFT_873628 [Dendrothele bispora CBS 962.96]|uniref:Uncharacterized protein n=1 Tax=Dendrothele bispora (strain CBS 962.96) TaxID=1314807 RepID=A0A4S8KYN2_DENBC|nr:hypothetical protein K435DRAFT_873628 [Dendrothele bispora CBS 962.96]
MAAVLSSSSVSSPFPMPSSHHRESGGMLRRLESKVNFRRSGRDSVTPSPSPVPPQSSPRYREEKVRVAGHTSYMTPSLRQASISSPALHLSSQALPSPKSQSAIPASLSSTSDVLASLVQERSRRSLHPSTRNSQSAARYKTRGSSSHTPSSPKDQTTRHRAIKSFPLDIPTSPSTTSLNTPPDTPKKANREPSSPPEIPTPVTNSRV